MRMQRALAGAFVAGTLLVSGCRIESDKRADRENVKIAAPFGGIEVKTNDAKVMEAIGLPVYPGAELVKKTDKNDGAADVNLSFGSFTLRVKAASYKSSDSPDKVMAFYRRELGRYGDVIQCENNKTAGTPVSTQEGLTCDEDHEKYVKVDDEVSGKVQLKAGSKQHQHIVAIDPDGSGTKLGIVALDLPGHFSFSDSDDQHK